MGVSSDFYKKAFKWWGKEAPTGQLDGQWWHDTYGVAGQEEYFVIKRVIDGKTLNEKDPSGTQSIDILETQYDDGTVESLTFEEFKKIFENGIIEIA